MKFLDIINEELTDKEIKKVKTLYGFYKTGIHRLDIVGGSLYKYELSDDYELTTHETNGAKKILVQPKGVSIYRQREDGTYHILDVEFSTAIELWMIKIIRRTFANHKIEIVIF